MKHHHHNRDHNKHHHKNHNKNEVLAVKNEVFKNKNVSIAKVFENPTIDSIENIQISY